MTTEPLASILINNYNYGKYLKAAIDSALNQTYKFVEIIVVDDGSVDDSRQVIESYGSQIKAILKPNGGQASAFNAGFQKSQGDFIFFLDSDDTFSPTKVEKIVNAFRGHINIGWCFHPLDLIDVTSVNSSSAESSVHRLTEDYSGPYDLRPWIAKGKLSGKLPFEGTATSGIAFRRSLLDRILPMPEDIRITSDDYIKYIALGISEGFILSEFLAKQLIHGNNAYTLRIDKQLLRVKIQLQTAYWMRKNFTELAEFSNSIFVAAKKILQNIDSSEVNSEIRALECQYLALTTWLERSQIKIRLLYRRFRP
jgi:glycosyltransferase involved in cell wall biosynthesis